jgi:hypothetical protein
MHNLGYVFSCISPLSGGGEDSGLYRWARQAKVKLRNALSDLVLIGQQAGLLTRTPRATPIVPPVILTCAFPRIVPHLPLPGAMKVYSW